MSTVRSLNFSCSGEGPREATSTRSHFDAFRIKLTFAHIQHVENPEPADILLQLFQECTFCSRPGLLSGDEDILTDLISFVSSILPDDEDGGFLASIVAEILAYAREIDGDPLLHRHKTVGLAVVVLFTTHDDDTSEIDRAILESAQDMENRRFTPASESSIKSLKRVRVSDNDTGTDDSRIKKRARGGEDCTICLEDISSADDGIVEMPCGHLYHESCIVKWLETSHFCPLCRFPMPVVDPSS